MTSSDDFPIAIIGAGFAGIGAAIQLEKAGITSYTIFERAAEIGGTWRDNTYPGAACDVQSHVYSLSFEPKTDWSHRFAWSGEIQEYLLDLVEKWRLRDHLRLNTSIERAEFDEETGRWTLTTSGGDTFEARVVLAGVGGLVDPSYPSIEGMDRFAGPMIHTARWDHEVDLAGKRVAVIGTGASAVQVVPAIAPEVAKLSVFQRTPGWVVPKRDREYPEAVKRLATRFPSLIRAKRSLKYWFSEALGPLVFLDSPRLASIGRAISLKHLEAQVRDPELRRKLTPTFQFGCKRILVSDEYWRSFNRDDVELVTDSIVAIREDGVETAGGTLHEVDAIVLATGFLLGLANAPFEIVGLGGQTLDDAWKNGAVAYKGMTVSGFPNWFTFMGPNTGPGHTSVLVYTEAQIRHALKAIEMMMTDRIKSMNVRQGVQDRYNEGIQARMKHMVWSGCASWYLNSDGTNRSLYPGFAAEYVLRTRYLDRSDYELTPA